VSLEKFVTTALRDAVAARLQASSDLAAAGVKVVTRQRGKMPSQIAESLASMKLAAVVLPAVVNTANPNQEPLYYDEVELTVRVVETSLNTGPEAEEIAELVHAALHSWQIPESAIPGAGLLFSSKDPMDVGEANGSYFVDCRFLTHGLGPFSGEANWPPPKIYSQEELDAAVAAALDAAGIPPPNLYGIWQRPMSRPAVPADAGTDNAYILLGIPASGLNASFTSGIEDWGDGNSQPGSTHFYPPPAPEELGEEGFLWRWVLLTPGATFSTAHPATAACVAEIYLTPEIGTVDLACLPLQNCNILYGVAVAGLVVSATNFVNLKQFSTTNKVACAAYADSVETTLSGNTSPMGSIPATTKFIKLNWDGATSGATLSIAHAKLNPNALDSFIADLPTVTTARNLTIGATQLYTAAQAAAALAKKWTFVGGILLPG
jgi:hypothetical protein